MIPSNVSRLLGRSRRVASDTHPLVERAVSAAVRYYATAQVERARVVAALRYDALIDPHRLYEVDPQRIDRTVSWTRISADPKADEHPRFRRPKYRLAGRVFDGDWDRTADNITDSTVHRSFRAHFEDGVPWERTDFYAETLAAIEAGAEQWDCRSEADLQRRCEQLDDIYERMATEGYRTQNELYERGHPDPSSHRIYRVIWGEISVHVGRDGGFVFQDGRNRLAMARVLGLESIPVAILVRHEDWQRKRDRIARGDLERSDLPERLRTHPDLVGLF
jgi:hypothetical protein